MTVDLNLIAAWIGTIAAIGAPVMVFVKYAKTLMCRLKALEGWTKAQQHDIEHSKEERTMLLKGTLACLDGLHQQGCNGAVTKSIEELEAFLYEGAHKGRSSHK